MAFDSVSGSDYNLLWTRNNLWPWCNNLWKNLSHDTVEINDDEINKIIDKFQKQTNNINSTDGEAFKTMYSKELRPYEEVISLIDFTLGGTYMDQYKKY